MTSTDDDGKKQVLNLPKLKVLDGNKATLMVGDLTYTIEAQLVENDQVEIGSSLAIGPEDEAETQSLPTVTTKLGETAILNTSDIVISITPTLSRLE